MANGPPPPRPPPQLPLETIAHIINLSSSRGDYLVTKTNYAVLRRYCLVSRTWRHLAQAKLFAFPRLSKGEAASSFLQQLRGERGASLSSLVKNISFWGETSVRTMRVHSIMGACTGLRRLCFSNLLRIWLEWLDLLPSLDTLVLCEVSLKPNSFPSSGIPLASLSMVNCFIEPGILAHFLSPTYLPSLRALTLVTDLDFLDEPNSFASLAAELDVYAGTNPEETHWDPQWPAQALWDVEPDDFSSGGAWGRAEVEVVVAKRSENPCASRIGRPFLSFAARLAEPLPAQYREAVRREKRQCRED